MTIKLIVGLANPGDKYVATRHNAGAWYIYLLAKRYHQDLKEEKHFLGYTGKLMLEQHNIRLLVPKTFMNLSGKAVTALSTFYHIAPEEIMVAHDELHLLPGHIQFRFGGSPSGHNGIKDIISQFNKKKNFYRLRIGIGHPGDRNQIVHFVLGKPSTLERKLIDDSIDEAVRNTQLFIQHSIVRSIDKIDIDKK